MGQVLVTRSNILLSLDFVLFSRFRSVPLISFCFLITPFPSLPGGATNLANDDDEEEGEEEEEDKNKSAAQVREEALAMRRRRQVGWERLTGT